MMYGDKTERVYATFQNKKLQVVLPARTNCYTVLKVKAIFSVLTQSVKMSTRFESSKIIYCLLIDDQYVDKIFTWIG